jgi:redox-sensitive bicupin YhaK (pirin superfamily)
MRQGYIDHSDSLGATARFGRGDVQWLTAGKGIVHSEMFPLLNSKGPNPAELFQIWLNLPSSDKFVEPYFSMFWDNDIPRHKFSDSNGRTTEILVVAGNLATTKAPAPPPNSWAARASADVAIWTIKMAPEAQWTLPAAAPGANRTLYLFKGNTVDLAGHSLPLNSFASLRPESAVTIRNGKAESEFLLLQGKPIGEPVVQYGPFVMNSERRSSRPSRTTREQDSVAGHGPPTIRCSRGNRAAMRGMQTAESSRSNSKPWITRDTFLYHPWNPRSPRLKSLRYRCRGAAAA